MTSWAVRRTTFSVGEIPPTSTEDNQSLGLVLSLEHIHTSAEGLSLSGLSLLRSVAATSTIHIELFIVG